jgi:hypothetical protein
VTTVSPVSQSYDSNGSHVMSSVTVAINFAETVTPVSVIVASCSAAGPIDGAPPVVSARAAAGSA